MLFGCTGDESGRRHDADVPLFIAICAFHVRLPWNARANGVLSNRSV
jgi:hypothetical protein